MTRNEAVMSKGIEKLPEDICLRSMIHLWNIVAKVSEKRRVNDNDSCTEMTTHDTFIKALLQNLKL